MIIIILITPGKGQAEVEGRVQVMRVVVGDELPRQRIKGSPLSTEFEFKLSWFQLLLVSVSFHGPAMNRPDKAPL